MELVSLDFKREDPELLWSIRNDLGIEIQEVKICKIYRVYKEVPLPTIINHVFGGQSEEEPFDWVLEIRLKPGFTDNLGKTAQTSIEDFLQKQFHASEKVLSATRYFLKGDITREDVERIGHELLANKIVEEILVAKFGEKLTDPILPQFKESHEVEIIDLNQDLLKLSEERILALNLKEMEAIKAFKAMPTDVELEAIAQTWSEHCKHKIFNAKIEYIENGKKREIDSLFKTYIKKATELTEKDWLVSVFTDNAGIIRFNDEVNLTCKVETHNSPSALDPYGGALTGILGVNRDILGTGIGSKPIANMDVLCFAPPDYAGLIPERLLHPKRILKGVCKGIEHGGNKSGIPTVNGAVLFDERYLGKPLVYCGTVGVIPKEVNGKPSEIKEVNPGDLIAIAGGKTGKDGIHGATFSSYELNETSPTSAVQIGDPFTQKKLHDFIMEARDQGLYRTLTDNGAGGISSSVGEMANFSGGCEIHLEEVPLKVPFLLPWEILLSESQERMTFAVPPESKEKFAELASFHEVDFAFIGTFTDSGNFHVLNNEKTVAHLPLKFLHEGVPQLQLKAEWKTPIEKTIPLPASDLGQDLHQLLSRFNICSKESIVRQYDHEVQGATAIKPLAADASVLLPLGLEQGIVISNGIAPRYSDIDAYKMAAYALMEAISNQVAVGADPDSIAILDNFCWPDPVNDPYKLAQLVRACEALFEGATTLQTPIISGKDSMKNDYKMKGVKISIPPTLLITAIGKIPNVKKAVTMDVKKPGDLIYLLGNTKNEMGGSEYHAMKKLSGGVAPTIDFIEAKRLIQALYSAIGLISSCHDCSDGGLAVALAESAFTGGFGMEIACEGTAEFLFSESSPRFVITVDPEKKKEFESHFDFGLTQIGFVREDERFKINDLIDENIYELKKSWQKPLF